MLQRLLDFGVYSEKTTKRVFSQILTALDYLHCKNIVHRDLKPENVLLTTKNEDAIAKVGDFGLARYLLPERMGTSPPVYSTLLYFSNFYLTGPVYSTYLTETCASVEEANLC